MQIEASCLKWKWSKVLLQRLEDVEKLKGCKGTRNDVSLLVSGS